METYNGHVRTPADAIILFEACRLGLLPRVQRRLSEKERQSIKSGSVFVWDEREAGMRRWTDGKSWSASRVSGSFLTYREMEGKRGGSGFAAPVAAARAGKTPDSARGSDSDPDGGGGGDDGPDGYRYKPNGLMKQSFSITTSTGQHLHLISYYARSHPSAQALMPPTADPALRHIRPQKGMYPESTVHEQQNVPVVTRGPMSGTPFAVSPHSMPAGPAAYGRVGAGAGPGVEAGRSQGYAQPGYGWPAGPFSGPPSQYHVAHYPVGLPPPPGSVGHPSLGYAQPMSGPTSQPGPPISSYDRPPPPLSESSLPPPPPPPHHRSPMTVTEVSHLPQYIPNPSPRVAQATLVAQQQSQILNGHGSSPIPSKIDPRLTSSFSRPNPPVTNISMHTPPAQMTCGDLGKADRLESNGRRDVISSTTIPSIGSLMNGSSKESIPTSEMSSIRAESRSPADKQKREGPQDIPGDKLGFGEDVRALRVLDRAFSA
ncbi:MAG: hypothetical protein M1819_006755 [Sarea resinae]|nr:MAG: hypothetical protein M1819_006755 [Sarea resinae]